MDLALITYKGWYAIKPNKPTYQPTIQLNISHLFTQMIKQFYFKQFSLA